MSGPVLVPKPFFALWRSCGRPRVLAAFTRWPNGARGGPATRLATASFASASGARPRTTSSLMSGRRWTVRVKLCVAMALVGALATPVPAQNTDDAMRRCYDRAASADLDRLIAGCTAIIESAQFALDQKLDALAARGILFRKTGRFDFAIVDLTEVLRNRADADAAYVQRGMALVATRAAGLAM